MQLDILTKIGLTPTESKVYLEIAKLGESQIGAIIKRTDLHRGTVYNAIQDLIKKGYVNVVIKEKNTLYKISGVKIFETLLKEKEISLKKERKETKELIKKINSIGENDSKSEVEVFYGVSAFKSLFLDIYDICKKNNYEYLFLGRGGGMQDATGEGFYKYTQRLKKKMNVRCRIILDKENIVHPYHKYTYGERRYMSSKHYSPMNIWTFGDIVFIALFKTTPLTCIKIRNNSFADGFRNYFETVWELIESEQRIVSSRHVINLYKFISQAEKSLNMMGICEMEQIHEGRETILRLLEEKKPVRVLLANPKSKNFKKRVNLEEQFIKNLNESRILFEWKAAMANLKDIWIRRKKTLLLEIRLFDESPNYTIIIIDGKKALYNKYGRKKRQYGASNQTLLLDKDSDSEFETTNNIFENYWKKAKPLIDFDVGNIL